MSVVLVENRLKADFAMVPRGLWRSALSGHAKSFAAYLFSLNDGALPSVLEMEDAVGFGRDARRKAFAELDAFGFLKWRPVFDRSHRIIAKTLVLDWSVFVQGPEVQARGDAGSDLVEMSQGPEVQARGKTTLKGTGFDPCRDTISGDLKKERKKESAARARRAIGSASGSRSVACADGAVGSAVCTASSDDWSFDAWLKLPLAGKPVFSEWKERGGVDLLRNGASYGVSS